MQILLRMSPFSLFVSTCRAHGKNWKQDGRQKQAFEGVHGSEGHGIWMNEPAAYAHEVETS